VQVFSPWVNYEVFPILGSARFYPYCCIINYRGGEVTSYILLNWHPQDWARNRLTILHSPEALSQLQLPPGILTREVTLRGIATLAMRSTRKFFLFLLIYLFPLVLPSWCLLVLCDGWGGHSGQSSLGFPRQLNCWGHTSSAGSRDPVLLAAGAIVAAHWLQLLSGGQASPAGSTGAGRRNRSESQMAGASLGTSQIDLYSFVPQKSVQGGNRVGSRSDLSQGWLGHRERSSAAATATYRPNTAPGPAQSLSPQHCWQDNPGGSVWHGETSFVGCLPSPC
jgi:hypothetical protein